MYYIKCDCIPHEWCANICFVSLFATDLIMSTWILRQNCLSKTNQADMIEFNENSRMITCPYGHIAESSVLVHNGLYGVYQENGVTAKGQDRRFVEEMAIGDIVVILYDKLPFILIGRITSNPTPPLNISSLHVVRNRINEEVIEIVQDTSAYLDASLYRIELLSPICRQINVICRVPRPIGLKVSRGTLFKPKNCRTIEWINEQIGC